MTADREVKRRKFKIQKFKTIVYQLAETENKDTESFTDPKVNSCKHTVLSCRDSVVGKTWNRCFRETLSSGYNRFVSLYLRLSSLSPALRPYPSLGLEQ